MHSSKSGRNHHDGGQQWKGSCRQHLNLEGRQLSSGKLFPGILFATSRKAVTPTVRQKILPAGGKRDVEQYDILYVILQDGLGQVVLLTVAQTVR